MRSAIANIVLALSIACAGVPCAHAQPARIVDLQLSGTLAPMGQLRPGTTATLTLVFRNNGPDDSPSVAAVSTAYVFGRGQQFALVPSLPSPCGMHFTDFNPPPGSGRPSVLIALVRAGPLPAGASRTCTFDVPIAAAASGATSIRFDVRDGAVAIDDPDPRNDAVSFGLDFDPPVPVPASHGSMLLLALATTLAAAVALRAPAMTGR